MAPAEAPATEAPAEAAASGGDRGRAQFADTGRGGEDRVRAAQRHLRSAWLRFTRPLFS